jgi:hypothetical protein
MMPRPAQSRSAFAAARFNALPGKKIENALAKLLKYAAVMCKAFHQTSSNHPSLITELAAYRA